MRFNLPAWGRRIRESYVGRALLARHARELEMQMARQRILKTTELAAKMAKVNQNPPPVVKLKGLTTDRDDPRLGHGVDTEPVPQNAVYLVKDDGGFVRPVRHKYVHNTVCGGVTIMGQKLAETYARDPKFYGSTYCSICHMHRPVSEFTWSGTDEVVGS